VYKAIICNNNIETLIHYPISDVTAPHLKELKLQEEESQIYKLDFPIYPDNPGYDLLKELKTYIDIIDTRDDSIRFSGRISDVEPNMDGMNVYKQVSCESALTYLNDTKMRDEALLGDLSTKLQIILDKHNSKVDSNRQIYLGAIAVDDNTAYQCDYKSCLETITDMKSKNSISGNIRIRKEDGLLYLDWMENFTSKVIDLQLGKNIQKMALDKDLDSFGTVIIPLGANNLTIKDVNGGLDYIEDLTAKSLYGYIEKTVNYSDITDAQELYDTCMADLSKYTQPALILASTANDLSFLTGEKAEEFELDAALHIVNPLMNIDANYKIVQLSLDLLQPYNPDVVISSTFITSTDVINDARNISINNDSVHNGVQVGDSFGIRVSSSDGKIIITINALEGISIEDVVNNIKKFFIDTNGNLTMDGIQKITKNGKLIMTNTFNDNGGLSEIYDNDGNLNAKVGSENGTSNNNGGTLILYNDGKDKPRVELGIAKNRDFGALNLKDSSGTVKALIYADDGSGNGTVRIADADGVLRELATKKYVDEQIDSHMGGGTSGS
jgi:hypothetical protein